MHFKVCFKLLVIGFLAITVVEAKQTASINYLNSLRSEVGLLPFTPNKSLTRAASSHAKYLTRQQSNGHYEKKGYKGFTGKTPTDRTLKAGYRSKMVMENLSVNAKNGKDAIENLMSAIYHRFVFLNTDKDEIGEGVSIRLYKPKIKTAFVYDLGTSSLRKLCKQSFNMDVATPYVNNVCKKSFKIIPQSLYLKSINKIRRKNAKIIMYPYDGQKNVLPAFFIEHPHPLPGSKVSGYPVSVQFNKAYTKTVKLKSFKLFTLDGKEIKKRKILTHLSDKNHKLTKYQFAFMPLKRLAFSTTYKARFEAIVDGKKLKKTWKFTTMKPKGKLYKITKKKTVIDVKNTKKIVLYFVPESRMDVLDGVRYKGKLKVEYLDANTLEVTLPKRGQSLDAGGRKVVFK